MLTCDLSHARLTPTSPSDGGAEVHSSLRLYLLQLSLHSSCRHALSIKFLAEVVSDVLSFLGSLHGQVLGPPRLGDTLAKDGGRSFNLLLLLPEDLRSNLELIPRLPQCLNLLSGQRKVLNFLRQAGLLSLQGFVFFFQSLDGFITAYNLSGASLLQGSSHVVPLVKTKKIKTSERKTTKEN